MTTFKTYIILSNLIQISVDADVCIFVLNIQFYIINTQFYYFNVSNILKYFAAFKTGN